MSTFPYICAFVLDLQVVQEATLRAYPLQPRANSKRFLTENVQSSSEVAIVRPSSHGLLSQGIQIEIPTFSRNTRVPHYDGWTFPSKTCPGLWHVPHQDEASMNESHTIQGFLLNGTYSRLWLSGAHTRYIHWDQNPCRYHVYRLTTP